MAFGRLRDGAKLQGARAELETMNRRQEAAWPATNRGCCPQGGYPFAVLHRPGCAHNLRLALGGGMVRGTDRLRQSGQSHAGANHSMVA